MMQYDENREYIHLGNFTLSGTTMRVTDPMYQNNSPHVIVKNCISGKWNAWTVAMDHDIRPAMLLAIAKRSGLKPEVFNNVYTVNEFLYVENDCAIKPVYDDVCVDSAHCGIFDDAKYVCVENPWGFETATLPHGVYCRSGWGDGRYPILVYAHPKTQKVAAVAVLFD